MDLCTRIQIKKVMRKFIDCSHILVLYVLRILITIICGTAAAVILIVVVGIFLLAKTKSLRFLFHAREKPASESNQYRLLEITASKSRWAKERERVKKKANCCNCTCKIKIYKCFSFCSFFWCLLPFSSKWIRMSTLQHLKKTNVLCVLAFFWSDILVTCRHRDRLFGWRFFLCPLAVPSQSCPRNVDSIN